MRSIRGDLARAHGLARDAHWDAGMFATADGMAAWAVQAACGPHWPDAARDAAGHARDALCLAEDAEPGFGELENAEAELQAAVLEAALGLQLAGARYPFRAE